MSLTRTVSVYTFVVCSVFTVYLYMKTGKHNVMDTLHNASNIKTHQQKQVDNRGMERPCTLKGLRRYYKEYHEFPKGGTWEEGENFTDFQPPWCQFSKRPLDPDFLGKCLHMSKLSSILILGDSNTGRYFRSLTSIFNSLAPMVSEVDTCATTRSEEHNINMMPNVSFYRTGDRLVDAALSTHHIYCKNCAGHEMNCSYMDPEDKVASITITRLPMTSLIDTSVSLLVPLGLSTESHDVWAPTTQEFFFRYFLRDRYPDVVLFFVPFSHIKQGANDVSRIRADIEYFHFFAKTYLPKTTHIFYLTGPAEHEHAKKLFWKDRLYQGMTANEKIQKLNQVMYDVIESDLIDPGANVYGFFDLMALGITRGNWTNGGIHMNYQWYTAIMTYIIDVICNSAVYNSMTFGTQMSQ